MLTLGRRSVKPQGSVPQPPTTARRLAARGTPAAQAVMQARTSQEGALTRVRDWQHLEASKYGMPPKLLELARQSDVTDILINGSSVWVDRGGGLTPVDLDLGDQEDCKVLAIRMAAAAGQRLDDASPIVDATIRGDIRLHAVLPPLARNGVSISLRTIKTSPFSLEQWVARGAFDERSAKELHELVVGSKSVLISGATGVGKTTLLATLLGLVPRNQRIVCIEEISEITADHPHLVQLQARQANVEGEGEMGLEELVRAAVRMRPDRIVLGECRGPEVREVLTAMNTGHRGSFATIHANSIRDIPARLTALGMLGGMSQESVASLAQHAFDAVIHMRRADDGTRYIAEFGHLTAGNHQLCGVVERRLDPSLRGQ